MELGAWVKQVIKVLQTVNGTDVFIRFFGGPNFERRRNGMQSVPILPESNSPEFFLNCLISDLIVPYNTGFSRIFKSFSTLDVGKKNHSESIGSIVTPRIEDDFSVKV